MLIFVLFCLALIGGLVLSFGDAVLKFLLGAGASVVPVSQGVMIVLVIIICVWILFWIFTRLVGNPESFIYRGVIPDGKAESFYSGSNKLVKTIATILIVLTLSTVAVLFSTKVLADAQNAFLLWASEKSDLVSFLHWIGNMLLSASVAFAISMVLFFIHPKGKKRPQTRHVNANTSGKQEKSSGKRTREPETDESEGK